MLCIGATSWGQDLIAVQDFESSPATPTLTFSNSSGNYSSGTNSGSYRPSGADRFVSGSRGWEVRGGTSTLTFNNQSLDGYIDVDLNLKIASMSLTTGNGADSSDYVDVYISLDGGSTYSNEVSINGSGNTYWSFTDSGSETVEYDGDNNPTDFTSSGEPNGISSLTVSLPNTATQVRVRVVLHNNSSNERWVIDDVKLTGTVSGPSVTTDSPDVDTDFAILNGTVSNGDATAVSFDYGTTTDYGSNEIGDPSTITGNGSFNAIVLIDVNTQYHYRAVAGSELGDDVSFWTLANVPNAPEANNVGVYQADITIGSGDGNPATTQYALHVVDEANNDYYVQTDGTLGVTAAWHIASEWAAITVNGLTEDSDYVFYAKARNGANVETAENTQGLLVSTLPNTAPTITADELTAFGEVCIHTTSTENSFGLYGENLTADNVVITAPTGYTLSNTAAGTYAATLTLTPVGGEVLEDIYVRFTPTAVQSYSGNITISGGGTSIDTNVATSGSGVNTGATVTTSSANAINTTTATLGGEVTDEGCSSVTARGVVIGTSATPSIGDAGVTNFAAASGGSGVFTVSATGLTSNTQYYARAYATTAGGTTYGSDITFTTLCGEFALPFTEGFDDVSFPPTCWTSFRGSNGLGTNQDWKRETNTSYTYNGSAGTAYVEYESVSGGNAEDWLVTPPIMLPNTDGTIELKYQEMQDFENNWGTEYYVKIATSNPSNPASYTNVINYGESDLPDAETSNYAERTIDLTTYKGQTVYIAFVMVQNNGDSWYIDDISITETAPPLAAPVAIAATDITTTSFTANWASVEGATSYRLDVSAYEEFGVGSAFSELIISEYVEGNNPGNNRAIELYNGTGNSIDLSEYSISRGDDTKYVLSGTLANGATYVIANSGAASGTLAVADDTVAWSDGTAMSFTGDEDVNLYKNFVLIDKVGAGNTNVTLRRKSTVTGPTTSYNSNEWDSYPVDNIDNLGSHTANGSFTPSYVTGYEDLNVSDVTSYEVTGLESGVDYFYRVRAVSATETSDNSNVIATITGAQNVWNGTEWTTGSAPGVIDAAIIEGPYNTTDNGTFSAATLTVNAEGSITVTSGTTLTISEGIVNNAGAENFIVEDNANIIQTNNVANTGAITVYKNSSPLYRLDYTMWSSPVSGQNLQEFSPQTLSNRFYTYNETTDQYNTVDPSVTAFATGLGYLIRIANDHPSYVNTDTPGAPWTGTFTGTPNNGDVAVNMSTVLNGYNIVGNPYPSPINVHDFYNTNSGTINAGSALYFWRKRNDAAASSYATVTMAAYTANSQEGGFGDTGSGTFTGDPSTWVINPGQGFIVQATGSTLTFNNSMRRGVNNGQFFRMDQENTPSTNISRLWLNITGNNGEFNQMAVAYSDVTTNELDYGWDGKMLENNDDVKLFSLLGDATKLSIQARAAFTDTDAVAVGYKATNTGSYTISLDHVDGLFEEGQQIYLIDNVQNMTHNLTEGGGYNFSTEAGTFTDRFEIIYTIEALDTNTPVLNINQVVVYKEGNSVMIDTGNAEISTVNVYDINGRLLYNAGNINATTTAINNLRIAQQLIILEINTNKGTVNKKFVF
ncbi:hypothetical protein GCM10007424_03840 [Flavobacterium suaedae]|uniref:LTD domain-containing protein n=1 Tax=Flavobacterium suaedae TaxID=1767027 RepID=A0ABQ1JH66_9FLAO|nr:hypothetical protein GCM10007424_03840 [Flavobacterium suaedae]